MTFFDFLNNNPMAIVWTVMGIVTVVAVIKGG